MAVRLCSHMLGWRYTWEHGYDLPLSNQWQQVETGKYELEFPFHGTMKDTPIEKILITLVLPEGARYLVY